MYYNYCIKSLSNFTMRQHEVVTDEFLPRKQNEAKCGTICPFVRARCSGTANWGAFSGARRIWAGVHLLADCLLPEKEPTHPYILSNHTRQQLRFCNPLTSNTLPVGLGTNCKSYKPQWKITKRFENVYWRGAHSVTEPWPPQWEAGNWQHELWLRASSLLFPRMELHENTSIHHVLSSHSPYYSNSFPYLTFKFLTWNTKKSND